MLLQHILLEGHGTYGDFSILLSETNVFKLHQKVSLLMKKDQQELNRNVYSHSLGIFD